MLNSSLRMHKKERGHEGGRERKREGEEEGRKDLFLRNERVGLHIVVHVCNPRTWV